MELFKQSSINWLGKKWLFLGISLFAFLLGVVGYFMHGGLNYGIDFTGGTIVYIKFRQSPNLDLVREALKPGAASAPLIQQYGAASENTVQVRMQSAIGSAGDLESGRRELLSMLQKAFDPTRVNSDQVDLNNVGMDGVYKYLLGADPDNLRAQNRTAQEVEEHYRKAAEAVINYRDDAGNGLIASIAGLKSAVSNAVVSSLEQRYYVSPFAIKGIESVGAVVGSDLRRRALLAVGLSILGMLVYIAIRFKPIYGVAAVLALVHDVTITVGFFALTQKEISLTVIAALLTLIGYSVNDTIVIFDRVRENLRLLRKESVFNILNLSINQTLSRTIMTSGFTFLAVFSLFLFGGEVLNGFSFALTVGIIIGSYSTIALASTVVDWWYQRSERTPKRGVA